MNIVKYINILFNGKRTGKPSGSNTGENIACKFLKKRGYRVIDKNFRSRYGEIDIVAVHKNVLCFVEVKSRKSNAYGLPEEYVDARKQKKLIKTSLIYCQKNTADIEDKRFDIVSVDLNDGECRLIINAFEADL